MTLSFQILPGLDDTLFRREAGILLIACSSPVSSQLSGELAGLGHLAAPTAFDHLINHPRLALEDAAVIRSNDVDNFAAAAKEAERAADILGAEVEFLDLGDYPLRVPDEALMRLVDVYRELQPAFVLSHSQKDPYNFDHPLAMHVAQEARIIAQAEGHNPGQKVVGAPPVYAFEPHQTEQCEWMPNTFLDITEVWDTKRRAIECMAGQEHLWEYYTRVALQRGVQAKRNIGITAARDIQYAEGYQRITPAVTGELA